MNKLRWYRRKEESKILIRNTKVRVKRLWLVMITFIFSTFAWIAYMRFLQPNTIIHIAAWKVEFINDDGNIISNPIEFDVENLYPGMVDYEKTISINNLGERDSFISYKINELDILGNSYVIKNEEEALETDSEYTVYKKNVLENGINKVTLLNNSEKYPFEIFLEYTTSVSASTLQNSTGYFKIRVSWPYELVNDATETEINTKNELDTLWGYNIAKYYNTLQSGDKYGLKLILNVDAKQMME